VIVIRWFALGPELLAIYPGDSAPDGARLLGVTVATAATCATIPRPTPSVLGRPPGFAGEAGKV
jgi:hypothetical protein